MLFQPRKAEEDQGTKRLVREQWLHRGCLLTRTVNAGDNFQQDRNAESYKRIYKIKYRI